MAFLDIENIKKRFGSNEVLKDISFSLEKGEVLAIIGSSGSGKTTLLRCLNFLEKADHGRIIVGDELLFDGSDKNSFNEKTIREKRLHFGLVFQSFNLFPQYTALKNILLAPEMRLNEEAGNTKMSGAEKRQKHDELTENAYALLDSVGLSAKANSYPCELSGGQCQRVAIARALALSPDILCFDEPTSALDPELTGEVLRVIRNLKSSERTMIVVTHEMEFARNVADRVIFMSDGIIEEEGTPDEVFGNPKSPRTREFLTRPEF